MKKYFISIDCAEPKIEVNLNGLNSSLIDGIESKYSYKIINDNVMVLRMDNLNFYFDFNSEGNEYLQIGLNGRVYDVDCKSDLDVLIEKMSGNKTDGKAVKEIKSPMPGIIKKVNVASGQDVAKGEVLLVLEAMKMENEIKAIVDCKIKKVNVEQMSSVEKNELLIILE